MRARHDRESRCTSAPLEPAVLRRKERFTRQRFRAAFTLIELLVSIVILATGIVAVLRAYDGSVVALGASREVLYGTLLARQKLAEVRADILVGATPTATASGRFEDAFEAYSWSLTSTRAVAPDPVTVGEEEEKEPTALYEAVVAVWRDGSDERQELRTYLRY